MALKTTNKRKLYHAPYAEMIECAEEDSLLDAVSVSGPDSEAGGENIEFSKRTSIWDEGVAFESDGVSNVFDN